MAYVLNFENGGKEQVKEMGGKGANLAEMTKLGLPIPKGFSITTMACLDYLEASDFDLKKLMNEVMRELKTVEKKTGKYFGGKHNPLLVSVRSGAEFSMPGMMDTILNLGLNDETVLLLVKKTDDERFAYDCYRRLLQMFGDVVCGINKDRFEEQLEHYKQTHHYQFDTDMTANDWKNIVKIYKDVFIEITHQPFPQNCETQLQVAIEAVFRSWNNSRARTYRRLHKISDKLGTAVTIQEMVFGNFGRESGTGVAFTRNPATGERGLFGEFLLNAQGEDVVAGIRTPQPIAQLNQIMPEVYHQFLLLADQLEKHYKDMQDIEFTIENNVLFLLQTRKGKRTARATFQIYKDLVDEKMISKKEAINEVAPAMITQLLHPVFDEQQLAKASPLARGLPASPGAACGRLYFTAKEAKEASGRGEKVVLIRKETSPEDIEGMTISEAIVTARGGMTSHAAVVARGMGVCCVTGCETIEVDEYLKQAICGETILKQGELVSIDGSTGKIYAGEISCVQGQEHALLNTYIDWAKELSPIKVKANAETISEIEKALEFGADGIGLVRTEHMFFEKEKISEIRKLILATTHEEREHNLVKLKEFQKNDFNQIFEVLQDKSCTIRLLDPPLNEFLPQVEVEIIELAKKMNLTKKEIVDRIKELVEQNPMLGHRGCRLAVTTPDIYKMQVRAIIESAIEVNTKIGKNLVAPQIMIPLIGSSKEMQYIREELLQTIEATFLEQQQTVFYEIGTMLEVPRACLAAGRIAEFSDFFSFGTNDLTQLTYGFSRDDSVKFLPEYETKNIISADPFQKLDTEGVGYLMQLSVDAVRKIFPEKQIGICGEIGGDPSSIRYIMKMGIDYISCSPYRIPAAILTIAQES